MEGEPGMLCWWFHLWRKSQGQVFKNQKLASTLMHYYVAMRGTGTFLEATSLAFAETRIQ